MRNYRAQILLAGAICVMLYAPVAIAEKKARHFKESCSGAFTGAAFSFDGNNTAGQYTALCSTNINGSALKSGVSQSATTVIGTCAAPDGTAGTEYNLLERFDSVTFKDDGSQIFSFSDTGFECFSNTTGVFSKTESWIITGGTGKFKNVTGQGTETITGRIIAKPESPGFGTFGAEQTDSTGTISW